MASSISSNLYREERLRTNKFTCDICGAWWPIGHRRRQLSSGNPSGAALYVGVMCCYEPGGGELDRDLRRAWATGEAARLSAKELMPPFGEDNVYYPGGALIPSLSWITSFSISPLVLTRGGAARSLVLTGVGFSASDTFVYSSTGLTDAAPPALLGSTQWTLSVQASVGMATGRYRMTFNKDVWQSVFEVR